ERQVTAGRNGTDVVETLTLEPTTPGPFTFPAAYFDAIDANTKKPSRFAANPVRVVVTSQGLFYERPRVVLFRLLAIALVSLVVLFGVLALVALVVVLLRRQRKPVVAPVAPPPP